MGLSGPLVFFSMFRHLWKRATVVPLTPLPVSTSPKRFLARFAGFGDGRFSLGWIVFITLKLAKSEWSPPAQNKLMSKNADEQDHLNLEHFCAFPDLAYNQRAGYSCYHQPLGFTLPSSFFLAYANFWVLNAPWPSVPPAVEDQKAPLSARRHGGFLRLGASHRKKLIVWKSSKKARQDESQDFSSRLEWVDKNAMIYKHQLVRIISNGTSILVIVWDAWSLWNGLKWDI